MTLSTVKSLIMTSLNLDTIRQKMDQAPKQQNKKHIQKIYVETIMSQSISRYFVAENQNHLAMAMQFINIFFSLVIYFGKEKLYIITTMD
jgi:hypothetical protein